MRCSIRSLCVLCLISFSIDSSAQNFVGDRGASCATIPAAGGNHVIALTGAVPVGSAVVIAAGTSANATFQSATDNRGNTYTPTSSQFHIVQGFRAFTLIAEIGTALQAGDVITIAYSGAAIGGESSCASTAQFNAIAFPDPTEVALGNASNTPISTHTISTGATTIPALLIHTSFVFNAATGGGGVNPGTPMQLVCSAGNAFCVMPAYRIVSSTGTYALTANTVNSVHSATALAAYRGSALLFKSGFE